MHNPFVDSLSLVDTSGQLILATVLTLLVASLGSTWRIRSRYGALAQELVRHSDPAQPFASVVLNRIVGDVREAFARRPGDVNTQAIVEQRLQSELKGLLVGERFVKASTSLAIILGLVGTFYGLTSAIGKLVGLVSGDVPAAVDVTQAVTRGLTQALAGMSVAFSSSLFGILTAITLTLVGVFWSISDRRTAVMVQIEAWLDANLLEEGLAGGAGESSGGARGRADKLGLVVDDFAGAVARLESAVGDFDAALERFATTTRDFREFNLHLKDNVQRMSLCFGDLSETLKTHVGALSSRVRS